LENDGIRRIADAFRPCPVAGTPSSASIPQILAKARRFLPD
jgi:hypothetical protein